VLNLPLEPLWVRHSRGGSNSAPRGRVAFRASVTDKLLPRLRTFSPDLLLISAGFDGAAGDDGNAQDDVGGLDLLDDDFRWITTRLCAAVGVECPVVSVLEGGYGTWDAGEATYDPSLTRTRTRTRRTPRRRRTTPASPAPAPAPRNQVRPPHPRKRVRGPCVGARRACARHS
jgi:hypothetical protein